MWEWKKGVVTTEAVYKVVSKGPYEDGKWGSSLHDDEDIYYSNTIPTNVNFEWPVGWGTLYTGSRDNLSSLVGKYIYTVRKGGASKVPQKVSSVKRNGTYWTTYYSYLYDTELKTPAVINWTEVVYTDSKDSYSTSKNNKKRGENVYELGELN